MKPFIKLDFSIFRLIQFRQGIISIVTCFILKKVWQSRKSKKKWQLYTMCCNVCTAIVWEKIRSEFYYSRPYRTKGFFSICGPLFLFCGFDSTIILLSFLDSCLIIAVMATFSCYLQQKWKAKLCQDQTGQTMQSTFVKWPRGIYQGKMKCRNCRRAIFVMYP